MRKAPARRAARRRSRRAPAALAPIRERQRRHRRRDLRGDRGRRGGAHRRPRRQLRARRGRRACSARRRTGDVADPTGRAGGHRLARYSPWTATSSRAARPARCSSGRRAARTRSTSPEARSAPRSPMPARIVIATPESNIHGASASARNQLLLGVAGSLLLIALVAYVEGAAIVRDPPLRLGRAGDRAGTPGRARPCGRGTSSGSSGLPSTTWPTSSRRSDGGCTSRRCASAKRLPRHTTSTSCCASSSRPQWSRRARRAGHPRRERRRRAGRVAPRRRRRNLRSARGRGRELRHARPVRRALRGRGSRGRGLAGGPRRHGAPERAAAPDRQAPGAARLADRPAQPAQCESALATELSQAQRFGAPLAFVLADIDDFKVVNDQFGHPAGDRAARVLRHPARARARR